MYRDIKRENIKRLITIATIVFAAALSGCASLYHANIMKGSILKQQGKNLYICIGTADGAKAGQTYNVYSYKEGTTPPLDYDEPIFTRIYTGVIKITRVVKVHYAKAVLISGAAHRGDIVELR